MVRPTLALPLALAALLAASPAGAQPRLDRVLPDAAQVSGRWQVVNETPTDARRDPDLVEWGVRDVLARHYTRYDHGLSQVCSIEVWAFESAERARVAHAELAYPQWEIQREGSLLVLVRGLTTQRGAPQRRGVFPACRELAGRVAVRAAASGP